LLQGHGRDFFLLYYVVVGLYFAGDDGFPFCELLVDGFAEHVENFVGLLGGSGIGAADHTA
jgi:hypothetical protein